MHFPFFIDMTVGRCMHEIAYGSCGDKTRMGIALFILTRSCKNQQTDRQTKWKYNKRYRQRDTPLGNPVRPPVRVGPSNETPI